MTNNKWAVGIILVTIGVITLVISGCYLLGTLVYAFGFGWLGATVSIADILGFVIPMIIEGVVALIGYILVRTNV